MPYMTDGSLLGVIHKRAQEHIGLEVLRTDHPVRLDAIEDLWQYLDLVEIVKEKPWVVYRITGYTLAQYMEFLTVHRSPDLSVWQRWLDDQIERNEFDKWFQEVQDIVDCKIISGYQEETLPHYSSLVGYLQSFPVSNRFSAQTWLKHLSISQTVSDCEILGTGLKPFLLKHAPRKALFTSSRLIWEVQKKSTTLRILRQVPCITHNSFVRPVKEKYLSVTPISYELYTQGLGRCYREWLIQAPYLNEFQTYKNHFNLLNILVHFRTKDRIDQGGESILFLEELQSDLLMRSKNGIPLDSSIVPWTEKELLDLGLKSFLYCAAKLGKNWVAWSSGEMIWSLFGAAPYSIYDHHIPKFMRTLERKGLGRCGTIKIKLQRKVHKRFQEGDCLRVHEEKASPEWVSVNGFKLGNDFMREVLKHGVPKFGRYGFGEQFAYVDRHE